MTFATFFIQFSRKLLHRAQEAVSAPLLLCVATIFLLKTQAGAQTAENPEQGANGSAAAPHDVTFQNGNLHGGNSHFLEGHSIPYHLVMTGLTAGNDYIIKIGMDALESGAAAIDYVTSIHNLTPHTYFGHAVETINPLEGTGFTEASFGANIQTIPLPAPNHSLPAMGIGTYFGPGSWNSLAAAKKSIQLFGASAFGNVWYDGSQFNPALIGTGNVTKPIYLTIHFTASGSTAVLAWGGHIAMQLDYGLNTTAATQISGAPYHTRRSGFWSGDSTIIYANEGADRSVQVNAIAICVVTAGEISGSQTICAGGDPATLTNVTSGSATGALTYQWLSNTTSCASESPWAPIGGATGATYDPPAGLTTTTYYKRVAYSDADCSDTSNCVTVTVNTVTAGTIGSDQTVCNPGNPAAFTQVTAATGSGTPSYVWQKNTTSCADGSPWATIGGATSATYDDPGPVTQTTYYRRIVNYLLNGVTCSDTSNCVTVTVNTVTGGVVGSDQTLCTPADPDPFTEITAATGSGTPSYIWQKNTTSCADGSPWATIVGATSATYDDSGPLTQTTYYRRIVTYLLNGVQCSDTSNCITVTVQECLDHIFPTGTTCANFEAQNVPPLLSMCFRQVGGYVTTANSPGAWFYYFYVTKPAGSTKISVKVLQSNDNVIQGLFGTSEIKAWISGTCTQINLNVTRDYSDPASPVITIDGLTNAELTIVISVKYNSNTIVGDAVTGTSSVYNFSALYGLGNNPPVIAVPGSGETLTVEDCGNRMITSSEVPRDELPQADLRVTAYPNPFNGSVYFTFVSPVSGKALLEVYDMLGRRVATVYQGHVEAGITKNVQFTVPPINRVPLFYRLTVGDKAGYGKLLPGGLN